MSLQENNGRQQLKQDIQNKIWLWQDIKRMKDKAGKLAEARYYATADQSYNYAPPKLFSKFIFGEFTLDGLIDHIINYWQQQLKTA